ncbi:glycosyltransferase family 2 protein [Vibrio sp. 1-Bac 57]
MNDLISVIIPVYNGEKYIESCIISILKSSYDRVEIIIINDGSNDSTLEILKRYNDKIKLINSVNLGANAARNIGLKKSTGSWVLFVDADDLIDKYGIEFLYEPLKSNANIDIVIGQSLSFGDCREISTNFKKGLLVNPIKNYMDGELPYTLWPNLYRSELIKQLKFVDDIKVGEDYVLNASAFMKSNSVFVIDKIVHKYRRHNESVTASTNYSKFEDSYKSFNMVLKIVSDSEPKFPQEIGFHKLQYLYSLIKSNSPFQNKCLDLVRRDISKCYLDINKEKLGSFRYRIIKLSLFSSSFAVVFGVFYKLTRRLIKVLVGLKCLLS